MKDALKTPQRYGISYIEQEESYTSLASALDLDNLPEYNADNPQTYEFSGKRIKRGLYRTKDRKLVNSDINGSANIGRKSKANLFEKREVLGGQMARSNAIFYRVKNPHRLALG